MGFFERITEGLTKSRDKFKEQMNILLDRGPDLDEEFWELLEETLILSDVGASAADDIVENLRDQATRQALPDAYSVLDLLNDQISATFAPLEEDIFSDEGSVVLFVGINGTGKTTTVGKIAKEYTDEGRNVILGSADTFRAAAIEQLAVWAERANVEMVTRDRGSDPASVCYDTIERAEATGADLVLIDTAGRLHTSADLMRELEKVVKVVRKRSKLPVYTLLVIDATTGQNGLQQAREFDKALDLDGLIITKLDGSAKGGIALAISHELELPIVKIGVGEGIEDLRDFNAHDFSSALIGDFDERYDEDILFTDHSDDEDDEVEVIDDVETNETSEDTNEEVLVEEEPIAMEINSEDVTIQGDEAVIDTEEISSSDTEEDIADSLEAADDLLSAEDSPVDEVIFSEPLELDVSTDDVKINQWGDPVAPAQSEVHVSEDAATEAADSEAAPKAEETEEQETEEPVEEKPKKKKHFWERWF